MNCSLVVEPRTNPAGCQSRTQTQDRYVGQDSVDISTNINQHACRVTPSNTSPPLSQHFTNTWPALRPFDQLLLLSSIFSTQLLLITFSSPLRGAFGGRRPFLAFHSSNIHLCCFFSYVFSSSSLLYRSLVTFKSSSFWGLLLSEVCYFRGAKNYIKSSNDRALFLPQDGFFISRPCDISQHLALWPKQYILIPPTVDRYTTDS